MLAEVSYRRARGIIEESVRVQIVGTVLIENTAVKLIAARWGKNRDLRDAATRIRADRVPTVMLNSLVAFSDGLLSAKNELPFTKLSMALMPS